MQNQTLTTSPKQWDHFLSSLVVRSGIGLSFGVIASVLLFKRRAWPAWIGLGFGAGRAWEEADAGFRRGGGVAIAGGRNGKGEGLRLVRT